MEDKSKFLLTPEVKKSLFNKGITQCSTPFFENKEKLNFESDLSTIRDDFSEISFDCANEINVIEVEAKNSKLDVVEERISVCDSVKKEDKVICKIQCRTDGNIEVINDGELFKGASEKDVPFTDVNANKFHEKNAFKEKYTDTTILSVKDAEIPSGSDTQFSREGRKRPLDDGDNEESIKRKVNGKEMDNDDDDEEIIFMDERSIMFDTTISICEKTEELVEVCDNKEKIYKEVLVSQNEEMDEEQDITLTDEKSILFDQAESICEKEIEVAFRSVVEPVKEEILEPSVEQEAKKACIEYVPPAVPASKLQVFISDITMENDDNNDPKWEEWGKLTTDEQRYYAVKKIWENKTVPDPGNNLTSYNWRNRNGLSKLTSWSFLKRTDYRRVKGGHLNALFYKASDDARMIFNKKLDDLRQWLKFQMEQLDTQLENELYLTPYMNHVYIYNFYNQEIAQFKNAYNMKREILEQAYKERISRISEAKEENRTLYKFYQGLHGRYSLLNLTPSEMKQWFEVDDNLLNYEHLYN